MERLRIAYVLPTLRKQAGWRTYTLNLLQALKPFVEQFLFVMEGDVAEAHRLFPDRQIFSLPATQTSFLTSRHGPVRLAQSYLAIRRGNFPEIDLVHSLESYPTGLVGDWLARRLSRRRPCPHVMSCLGTYGIAAYQYPLDKAFYSAVLRRAGAVCPISQGTLDLLMQYFRASLEKTHLEVVLLGTHLPQQVPRPAEAGNVPPIPTLLTVGDVKPRKGQDLSLAAFARIKQRFPEAQYWIVGDPHKTSPYYHQLETFIRGNGLDSVVFKGLVSNEELQACYQNASVFVLTPRRVGFHFEGFGLVYLEAGAYGLPVVGTRTGGVADAVHDEQTGLLAAAEDIEGIAVRILRLLQNPEQARRLGQANREWVETLTWERTAAQQHQVYHKALTGRSAR
jgi:glycosyltransferase involved in cell wall biosynthesis